MSLKGNGSSKTNYPGVDEMAPDVKKMIGILKRMEQPLDDEELEGGEDEEGEGEEGLDSDDENLDSDGPDLAERLADIDLNNPDEVWSKLTDDEKRNFESLLQSGDVSQIIPVFNPWWEVKVKKTKIHFVDEAPDQELSKIEYPEIHNDIPEFDRLSSKSPSPCVRFNLINILAGYTSMVRFFNGDHHSYPHEAASYISQISDNLKSNVNFETEIFAIESISHNCHTKDITESEVSVKQMKSDVDLLIEGPYSDGTPSNLYVLSSLSDLWRILSSAKATNVSRKSKDGAFTKRFADHDDTVSFGDVKKSTLNLYLKKIEYYLAFGKKFG